MPVYPVSSSTALTEQEALEALLLDAMGGSFNPAVLTPQAAHTMSVGLVEIYNAIAQTEFLVDYTLTSVHDAWGLGSPANASWVALVDFAKRPLEYVDYAGPEVPVFKTLIPQDAGDPYANVALLPFLAESSALLTAPATDADAKASRTQFLRYLILLMRTVIARNPGLNPYLQANGDLWA
jgi:hypothetical protein